MTSIAHITGRWMSAAFAYGCGVVVTTHTSIAGLTVIKRQYYGQPGRVVMAQLTLITGHRMGGRFKSSGTAAIMATAAEAGRRGLIMGKGHYQCYKAAAVMTGITYVTGQRMGGVLAYSRGVIVTA